MGCAHNAEPSMTAKRDQSLEQAYVIYHPLLFTDERSWHVWPGWEVTYAISLAG